MKMFRCLGRSLKSLLPVIFGVAALFLTTASLQAVVPIELSPNPNPAGNTIDTPWDLKPVPTPPDVTSFNNGNFTNYGTVNFWGSFDNNGTVNNYGTVADVMQCINHNNNPGAVINNMAGAYMDLGNGKLNNAAGATLNNYGRFNDSVGHAGSVENYGTIINHTGGFYHNQVLTQNFGTFINDGLYHGWVFRNSGTTINNGTFNHWSGIVENKAGATFLNNGTMTTNVWFGSTHGIDNSGTFVNASGASITNNIDSRNRAGGTWSNAGTITNNGTLTLDWGSAFTNTGSIMNNGAIGNNFGSTLTNSGTITNGAGKTLTNAGTLTSTGTLSNAGTLNNTGTLEMSGHDLTGGTLNNKAGGTLALRGDFTFGRAAAGTMNLNAGSILQNYAALTNPAGNTQANNGFLVNAAGGTLLNDGTINGSGTITNNGNLTGSGNYANNVTNNGIIAPGSSPGTLTIIGNYIHNPRGTYRVDIEPTRSDRIVATGTATLNGGSVQVIPAGIFLANTPYTYSILAAGGGVKGTFSNLTTTSPFMTEMSLRYLPHDVILSFMRKGLDIVCETENQCAVAGGLEGGYPVATGDMREILNMLLVMSAPQARNAYDQMGGYIHTAMPAVTFSTYNQYKNMMATRMAGFVSGGPFSTLAGRPVMISSRTDTGNDARNTLLAAANNTIPVTGNNAPVWGFWMDGYGSMNERRATDISSRYDYNATGIVFGFDRKITPSLLLGASAGYSYIKADLKDLSEDARISSYQGSLYGVYSKGPWYMSGIGSYAFNTYDTSRDMAFGTIARSADASYDSHLFAGYVEGGYKVITKYADIIPFAAFQATYLARQSFTEDGAAALNLDADKESTSSYLASLGVRLRKDYTIASGTVSPELRVRWDHELSNDNHSLSASFSGYPQTAFTVNADKPDRDRIATGVGLTLKTKGNLSINASYDGYFSNDTTQHSGMIGLTFKF